MIDLKPMRVVLDRLRKSHRLGLGASLSAEEVRAFVCMLEALIADAPRVLSMPTHCEHCGALLALYSDGKQVAPLCPHCDQAHACELQRIT